MLLALRLDREAAKQALGQFLDGTTHSANQIEFVNLIVNHLTGHGVMDAALLYESPLTKQRKLKKCEIWLRQEKQYNHKAEINDELYRLNKNLKASCQETLDINELSKWIIFPVPGK